MTDPSYTPEAILARQKKLQADDSTLEACIEAIPSIMADRPQSRLVWPIKRRET